MKDWKYLGKACPTGHKLFEDLATGRIAIADDSGRLPEQTEDGILWLDKSRPISMWDDGSFCIPILTEDGVEKHTGERADGALHLAARFGLPLYTPLGSYRIRTRDMATQINSVLTRINRRFKLEADAIAYNVDECGCASIGDGNASAFGEPAKMLQVLRDKEHADYEELWQAFYGWPDCCSCDLD